MSKTKAQLYNQLRDGIAPSRVWLPKMDCLTVLDFLCQRFNQIPREYWQQRIISEQVLWGDGKPVQMSSAYRSQTYLLYYREVPFEPHIPFDYKILYEDDELIVVDKPHFLPTNPAGRYVRETVLSRLKSRTGNPLITPLHRLDKDTAGILLFSKRLENRAAYHTLFAQHQIRKTYHAVLQTGHNLPNLFTYRSRLKKGEPFCLMQETVGTANAQTHFKKLAKLTSNHVLYELMPLTGQQHQLRVHCAAVGAPIVYDRFYPTLLPDLYNMIEHTSPEHAELWRQPLQLLAFSIAFTDPISRKSHYFQSRQKLLLDSSVPIL